MKKPGEIKQAYLDDLGLSSENVGLALLREIQSRHIAKYSFNNLEVLLSKEIPLDIETVFSKIVTEGRGGYCFEHNKLIFDVLSELGFDVKIKLARVVYNKKEEDVPRTHRITLVNLGRDHYVVDAGFGHFGARHPIKLESGVEQDQGDAIYQIVHNGNEEYGFQIMEKGAFSTLYTFDLNTYTEKDCLSGHFYSHKFPEATFVNHLVVSKKSRHEIHSLRNREFYHFKNGDLTTTTIHNADELRHILSNVYGLSVSPDEAGILFDKVKT